MADVRADMVANVMEIYVSEGDQINIGDTIVLLESMKMEIPVNCRGTWRSNANCRCRWRRCARRRLTNFHC